MVFLNTEPFFTIKTKFLIYVVLVSKDTVVTLLKLMLLVLTMIYSHAVMLQCCVWLGLF